MLPPATAPRGSSCMIESAVIDLPEPDFADDAQHLAGFDGEVDVAQDRRAGR